MATTRGSAGRRLAGEEEGDFGEASGAKILAGTEENTRVTSLATLSGSVASAKWRRKTSRFNFVAM
jgi:hypothetical protein